MLHSGIVVAQTKTARLQLQSDVIRRNYAVLNDEHPTGSLPETERERLLEPAH